VNCGVNWINFDRCHDIESRLFKAETQPTGTGKQINPYRSHYVTASKTTSM
jgi:hypothetical protein